MGASFQTSVHGSHNMGCYEVLCFNGIQISQWIRAHGLLDLKKSSMLVWTLGWIKKKKKTNSKDMNVVSRL